MSDIKEDSAPAGCSGALLKIWLIEALIVLLTIGSVFAMRVAVPKIYRQMQALYAAYFTADWE